MSKKLLFLSISLISFLGLTAQNLAEFSSEKLLEFGTYIENEIQTEQIAGAEVLLVKDNNIVWHKSFGNNNLKTQTPLQKNSIYYIQSMTKPLISVAVLQLIEKGLIGLDDAVDQYFPEIKNLKITTDVELGLNAPTRTNEKVMTIRHLLTHTAGFSHGLETSVLDQELFKLLYNETLDYKGHANLESRVETLLKAPLIGAPGEQWYYSAAPDLLALILQQVSKKSIPDYLKENILDPLDMIDTGYNLNEEQAKRVMQLHSRNESGGLELSPLQVPTQGNRVYGGTHGLFSSPKDYLNFCQMILNKGRWNETQILSKESVALLSKNHIGDLLGPTRGFGLGFGMIRDSEADPSPGSSGQLYWGGYFRTHFFIDPALNLIALFMTQKLPEQEDYAQALNTYVYAAIQ